MRYFLGGVNGAGKTTFLQNIKAARPEFKIIKGSQELMRFLHIEDDYDALRDLDESYKLSKLGEMLEELFAKHEHLIFDAHYLNLVRGTISKVTDSWIKDFDLLLLIQVSAETILERIKNENRDRALFPDGINEVQKLQMLQNYISEYEKEFAALCDQFGVPGKILNGEKSPREVADEFLKLTL